MHLLLRTSVAAAAFVLLPTLAVADEPGEPPPAEEAPTDGPVEARTDLQWRVEADYRVRGTFLSKMRVQDPDRYRDGEADLEKRLFGTHRLRLGLALRYQDDEGFLRKVETKIQGDIFDGLLWGGGGVGDGRLYSESRNPRHRNEAHEGLELRQLSLEFTTTIGLLRIGRSTWTWGTGAIAGSGSEDLLDLRGDQYYGDIVDRLLFATRPLAPWLGQDFPLGIAIAGDRIARDDLVDTDRGDEAYNVFGAVLYDGETFDLGGLVAWRHIENDDGDITDATAVDIYAAYEPPKDPDNPSAIRPYVKGEVVIVTGETDAARSRIVNETAEIAQFGGVLQGGVHIGEGLSFGTDIGFASGDGNPFDAKQNALTLDRDFRVGLIMFREHLAAMTAGQAFHLADRSQREVPSDGAELLPSQGGVRNAIFAQVAAGWRPIEPLSTRLGVVWARAHRAFVDPFSSFIEGERVAARGGKLSNRDYGWELDFSTRFRLLKQQPGLSMVLHSGVFWPGNIYEDNQGHVPSPIYLAQFGMEMSW